MPLTTSTMRAAALMPLCVYFHFSPGSYCIGAASQSGTRSASVFAFCASGPLASPSPEVWVRICRSEEHTSELQSRQYLVCRLLLEKKKDTNMKLRTQYNTTTHGKRNRMQIT